MAAYTDLTTNERLAWHEKAMVLHSELAGLNRLYQIARTAGERTVLRQAAAPILTQLEAWTYNSVAGTLPD